MFAVVVTFVVKAQSTAEFMPLILANAKRSLALEDGCHQFDVCADPERPNEVFLYELYRDAPAFQTHLSSAHFQAFNSETLAMLADKQVKTYMYVTR